VHPRHAHLFQSREDTGATSWSCTIKSGVSSRCLEAEYHNHKRMQLQALQHVTYTNAHSLVHAGRTQDPQPHWDSIA
jgi:hypothetical protein